MGITIEWKKLKRSGYFQTVVIGGLITGFIPVLQLLVRERIVSNDGADIMAWLIHMNWNLIVMIQSIINIVAACILYHIEYEERGNCKMAVLPIKSERMHWNKWLILMFTNLYVIVCVYASFVCCMKYWYSGVGGWSHLLTEQMIMEVLAAVPCSMFMLLAAYCTTNLWMSLGIGVIALFLASMIRGSQKIVAAYPFSLAFVNVKEYILPISTLGGVLVLWSAAAAILSLIVVHKWRCQI